MSPDSDERKRNYPSSSHVHTRSEVFSRELNEKVVKGRSKDFAMTSDCSQEATTRATTVSLPPTTCIQLIK